MPTILLVDDDADFVEMHCQVLQSAGYQVLTASNRVEALAALARGGVDLVITDLMMGELDSGFSLAAQVKGVAPLPGQIHTQGKPIPVIMTTSVTRVTGLDFRPKNADDLAKMNVDAYFEKPVRTQALLAKVRDLLNF